jgi:hypothetical protein
MAKKIFKDMTIEERMAYIVQRIATSDIASSGKLNADQSNKFIQLVVDNTALKGIVKTETMIAATKDLDTIDLSTRQMTNPTEGTESNSISATFAKRTMTAVEYIYPVDLTYSFLEDNIERQDFEDSIIELCAKAVALDLEDLSINGDDDSATTFIAQNDGYIVIAKAAGHLVDITSPDDRLGYIFPEMLDSMPDKWKANRSALRLLMSSSDYEDYEDEIADRNTALGDMAITTGKKIPFKGVEIVTPPAWPTGEYMMTPVNNLRMGIHREILFEKERQPRARTVEITISGRCDFEIAIVDAVVIGYQAT